MAIIIGSESGFIGDTDNGFDLFAYVKQQLAKQCYMQHRIQDPDFVDIIESYLMDEDSDAFCVEYASGCVWSYTCIDEGYEGMQKKHINQGN